MLTIGDKIRMIRAYGMFNFVGQVFEVIDVDDKMYQIKCDFGMGYIGKKEYKNYFEKVEEDDYVTCDKETYNNGIEEDDDEEFCDNEDDEDYW